MELKHPKDVKEIVYNTQRPLSKKGEKDESGYCRLWVFRPKSKCGELMFKPKRKAVFFECEKCGEKLDEADANLLANFEYTCPYCGNEGAKQEPWIRSKSGRKFSFSCDSCGKKLEVSKLK